MANYLTLKRQTIDIQLYYRLRYCVPQSAKLYGLPKLDKPNTPMRPIVSFCGSPTYQVSKHFTNILKPLTDNSRHKLQSTDNFIWRYQNGTNTRRPQACILRRQITFNQHTTPTCPWLYWDRHQQITLLTTITHRRPYGPTAPLSDLNLLSVQR